MKMQPAKRRYVFSHLVSSKYKLVSSIDLIRSSNELQRCRKYKSSHVHIILVMIIGFTKRYEVLYFVNKIIMAFLRLAKERQIQTICASDHDLNFRQ